MTREEDYMAPTEHAVNHAKRLSTDAEPTALAVLLARVEAATGPDEGLDALILCTLAAPAGSYVEQSKINGVWCIYTKPGRLWERSVRDGWWRPGGWPVTASLDAALALVERVLPGWAWMARGSFYEGDGKCFAKLWKPYATPPGNDFDALAATPPLALLAALFRALSLPSKIAGAG